LQRSLQMKIRKQMSKLLIVNIISLVNIECECKLENNM